MKLWLKSTITIGSMAAITGATIGGVFLYNKHAKSANGIGFSTSYDLRNEYPNIWKNKETHELKSDDEIRALLKTYFYDASKQITDNIADYDSVNDEVGVQKTPYKNWFKNYVNQNGMPPQMVCYFGSAAFVNDYVDAVSPKDFVNYVLWFVKSVPWAGDTPALETFSISRGVVVNGSAITLGAHTSSNKESTQITFYPDAFFGSMPGYSVSQGAYQASESLLVKLSNAKGTLLTQDEIQFLLDNKDELVKRQDFYAGASDSQSFNIRYIKPIEMVERTKADGTKYMTQGYEVYIDAYKGLIDDVTKDNGYLLSEMEGLHVENGKLVNGKYKTVTVSTRIPFLSVLHAADEKFKGPGINWLKEVGAHEYGHHTTLQLGVDASEDFVYSSAFDSMKGLNIGSSYSRQMINLYLLARSHHLVAEKADVAGNANNKGEFISWVENGKAEAAKDIFGSENAHDLQEALRNKNRRTAQTYEELIEAAKNRGVDIFDLFIENSWDHRSGTLNPSAYAGLATSTGGTLPMAQVYDADGHLVQSDPNTIAKSFDAQGHAQPWTFDSTKTIPAIVHWFDGGQDLGPAIASETNTSGEYSFNAAPTGHPDATIGAYAYKPNGNGGFEPIVAVPNGIGTGGDAERELAKQVFAVQTSVANFLKEIKRSYGVNGWDAKGSTVKVGDKQVTTIASLDGVLVSQEVVEAAGMDMTRLVGGLGKFMTAIAPNSPLPGVTNVDLTKGEDMNILLGKMPTQGDLFLKVPDFKASLGFNQKYYGAYGGAFNTISMKDIGLPISAMDSAKAKEFGYQSLDPVEGLGTYVSTPNGKYSIIPTSSFTRAENPTEMGFVTRHLFRNTEEQTKMPLNMKYTDDQNNVFDAYFETVDGVYGTAYYLDANGTKQPVPTSKVESTPVASYFGPDIKYIQAVNAGTSTDGIPSYDADREISGQEAIDAVEKYNNDHPGTITKFVKSEKLTGVVEYKGLSVVYDKTIFENVLAAQAKQYGYKAPNGTIKDFQINSISSLLDAYNIDPFADFEFVTVNNHKIAVLNKTSLSHWFEFDAIKLANNWDDAKTQQQLTRLVFASNLFSFKETPAGHSLSDASWGAANSSLFAMLSNGGDQASLESEDLALPESLRFKGIELSNMQDLTDVIATIKKAQAENPTYNIPDDFSYAALSLFLGQQRFGAFNDESVMTRILASVMVQVGPSQDIVTALNSRMTDQFNDKFSDYAYSTPEEINRDWLQITYMPGTEPTDNIPNYITGISERSAGFEYYIDGSATSKYRSLVVKPNSLSEAIYSLFNGDKVNNFDALPGVEDKTKYEGLRELGTVDGNKSIADINFANSSLLGKASSVTNGFFNDVFQRQVVENEVFDAQGNAIHDDQIRITDFDGSKVIDKARATWVYAMKTNGVGSRTVAGLWRSPSRDSSYMFGYVPFNTQAEKDAVNSIKYLKFVDKETHEVKLLPVHTQQNNLFYYEDRAPHTNADGSITMGTKHYIEQDGYTTWTSDYAPFGGYRDALLKSGHQYQVDFADENGNVVSQGGVKFDMGDPTKGTDKITTSTGEEQINTGRNFICENGKPYGQASTWLQREKDGSATIVINNQFNGN